ncbi:hypothetical protein [Actinomadura sp. SCN-SB]|uniref:hypothetical protein n=1 Tax=Actinomadura sp. SCN-SB TaxID=3373092 RepID=UPI0037506815
MDGRSGRFEQPAGLGRVVAPDLDVVQAGAVLVEEVPVRAGAGRRDDLDVQATGLDRSPG